MVNNTGTETLNHKVITLLITAIGLGIFADIHYSFVNPLVNNIVMFEKNEKTSKKIKPIQFCRAILTLIIYIILLYSLNKVTKRYITNILI
tara:strand:+ start:369 stop:641 length:273 start_codon:yes stop_codon:yes gene_type:complete